MSSVYGRLPVSGHYLRKRLRYASFARRLAAFALVLLVAAMVIYRLGAIAPQALIGLLLLVAGVASVALLISVVGLIRVWYRGVDGGRTAMSACFLSLVALFPFALVTYLAFINPRANAAYTEALAPDGVAAAAVTQPPTGWRSFFAAPAAPEQPSIVSGRRYVAEAPRVFQTARMVVEDSGWQIGEIVVGDPSLPAPPEPAEGDLGISGLTGIPIPTPRDSIDLEAAADPYAVPESDQYRIEAVARDLLFGLPSDMVIRIAADDGDTYVDMQSMSRSTGIDLGENRRIIEGFLADLDTAMAGLETIAAGE
ncbi:DUF1499 domain-containing protein [Aurantimonas aggregata]|uniref:DUF1499 domain-containing protein n=1 Tax=Aurantimonas aggregata TaxID=2047720 RepID=A0A6L9ME49_9HYPH|nr:DUF1499 domain-containing protein [Aurantimonas aggregata]NDV85940.1 DUF1499 domain-containing protein [Aurantimonas aggregata]